MAVELEVDLRTLLLTFTPVTALVGTGDSARIRPDRLNEADDDSQPHILIHIVNEEPQNDLSGRGGLVYADVDIECRAKTKAKSRAVAEAVRLNGTDPGTGLAGYTGTPSDTVTDGVLEDVQTAIIDAKDGSDQEYYTTVCRYVVCHQEVI